MVRNGLLKSNQILTISLLAALISLIMTPWVNVDSLIIPKLIIFFSASLYFLVIILVDFNLMFRLTIAKPLIILLSLMMLNLLIILITSDAPFEQQIFGKTGRGLGLLTEFATIIFILATFKFIDLKQISSILGCLLVSSTISSLYSIFQFFGLDIFQWYTRTNGIIGTLGNPNFQGAFSALAIPASLFFINRSRGKIQFLSICSFLILAFSIYLCQSTQGYILFIISVGVLILFLLKFKNFKAFLIFAFIGSILILLGVLGMLNRGPLSNYLYKVSVQSRGEFWRTALSTFRGNPTFGVGLDSFGDYSQRYRSQTDAAGINEFTDNAHNYFLNYAANNGIFFTILYLILVLMVFISFLKILKFQTDFNLSLIALFSVWLSFQAQSLISPGTIAMIVWNSIFSGAILGIFSKLKTNDEFFNLTKIHYVRPLGIFLAFLGVLVTYPLYKVDSWQLKSLNTKDALLGVKSATSYPESTLRYSRIGVELLKSELWEQALIVGRSAVKFNPNSASAWALILANSRAPISERIIAKNEILRIDPFNEEIKQIVIPNE